MLKRVSEVSTWIIATAVSISMAALGIYINSAPIVSVSCVKCEACYGGSCLSAATEDFTLWGMIQKQNWEFPAIYLILFLACLYAVALIAGRFLFFYKADRQSREFKSKSGGAMLRGHSARAVRLSRDYPDSPVAFVISMAFGEQREAGYPRPSMRLRHHAIVAKTAELRRGLWHLSAIGWLLALLSLLSLCIGAIDTGRMMRYSERSFGPYIIGAFSESVSVFVYCALAGFVVLAASRYFTATVEHFQLEMDRLSLAFIEGVTSTTDSLAGGCQSDARYENSRITDKLRKTAGYEDWNIIADAGV